MNDDLLEFSAQQPLFAGLDRAALAEVARALRVRKAARGEQILLEGEPSDSAYFVASGQVRVYRLAPNGREQALADLFAGQCFNLVPAVDGRPAPASVAARTDATLYLISRADFAQIMTRHPSVARAVLRDFAGRLRQMTSLIEELALHSVAERLARLLVRMVEGEMAGRFTQQELANRLGTVREVISRTLRDFQTQGLIRMERQNIIVLDRDALMTLACGL
jgi:CRP/FNR family transcriptional regulator